MTVTWLAAYGRAAEAVEELGSQEILTFRPRICPLPEGACILYPGDAGYEAGDISLPGPRHRLWTRPEGWEYERR